MDGQTLWGYTHWMMDPLMFERIAYLQYAAGTVNLRRKPFPAA